MKAGDLVKFRNLDPSWGIVGLIVEITSAPSGVSMIKMITKTQTVCTIPWSRRNTYVEEVISEVA